MKKPGIYCLLAVIGLLLIFLISFQLWRAADRAPVYISAAPQTKPSGAPFQPETGAVNINTATLEQLQTLPGIGPVLAQRILDYRQEHGPFSSVSQLTLVPGIGITLLNGILDYITVGG